MEVDVLGELDVSDKLDAPGELDVSDKLDAPGEVGFKITAPTTSGPAQGPRPTSSMPRMGTKLPSERKRCLKWILWIRLVFLPFLLFW